MVSLPAIATGVLLLAVLDSGSLHFTHDNPFLQENKNVILKINIQRCVRNLAGSGFNH
jgi:hypothetical protein